MSTESYSALNIIQRYYGNATTPGAQIPFNFQIINSDPNRRVGSLEENINSWLLCMDEYKTANWVVRIFKLFNTYLKHNYRLMSRKIRLFYINIHIYYHAIKMFTIE